jgi:hypothetical protein
MCIQYQLARNAKISEVYQNSEIFLFYFTA